jgi:hypothetical protein
MQLAAIIQQQQMQKLPEAQKKGEKPSKISG